MISLHEDLLQKWKIMICRWNNTERLEKELILRALENFIGIRLKPLEQLGIRRTTLQYKKKTGLE
jgi:transcriptional regulator with AAA-type ATPase domain